VRHDAAENVMHKASGTFDHLEYIKVVNMPSTSSCHLGLVPSYWLQHHEGLASHEMLRCTASPILNCLQLDIRWADARVKH